jgi:hypothetical protein
MRGGVRSRHGRADMEGRQFTQRSGCRRQAFQKNYGRQALQSREGTWKAENSLKGVAARGRHIRERMEGRYYRAGMEGKQLPQSIVGGRQMRRRVRSRH